MTPSGPIDAIAGRRKWNVPFDSGLCYKFGLMKSRLFATKSLEQLTQEASSDASGLKRVLGPWHLIFLGVGAIIGAGIFVMTGQAAAHDAGPAVIALLRPRRRRLRLRRPLLRRVRLA